MDYKMADRLIELRKKKGYSQDELAEKLNISRQAVSKWERAESFPDTENLIALSRLYNISLDRLVHGVEFDNDDEEKDADIEVDVKEVLSEALAEIDEAEKELAGFEGFGGRVG